MIPRVLKESESGFLSGSWDMQQCFANGIYREIGDRW